MSTRQHFPAHVPSPARQPFSQTHKLAHAPVEWLIVALLAALFIALPQRAFAQGEVNPDAPYISEVAPTGNSTSPAWVEITMGRVAGGSVGEPAGERVMLPLVGGASGGEIVAAQVYPDTGFNLHGWHLSDMDGNTYDVPISLPFLAEGTVVVIYFDGKGAGLNDMDPSDGIVSLHTPAGMTNIFDEEGDQLALHDPSNNLISFVAWGTSAGEDGDEAVAAGLWAPESFVIFDSGFGASQVDVPPAPNASIGIWQNAPTESPNGWVGYAAGNSTPGMHNPPPAPLQSTVPDNAIIGINGPSADGPSAAEGGSAATVNLLPANEIALAWSGMGSEFTYEFQVASDPGFSELVITKQLDKASWAGELPEGDYYWRTRLVAPAGNFGRYLGPYKLSIVDLLDFTSLGTIKMLLDADEYKIQHKDSTMLDIGGGTNNVIGNNNPGNRRYPADRRWDGEHVDAMGVARFGWNGMDNIYCVRASTAMINDYYGGNLTQDRISYYAFEELNIDWYGSPANLRGVPEHDLGFGVGIGSYSIQENVLNWALGNAGVAAVNYCPNPGIADYSCPNPAGSPMTFAEVKAYIDAGKPFMSINLNNAHARVVDGYWELSATSRWVHLIDPVPADTSGAPTVPNAQWIAYDTFTNNQERVIAATGNVNSPRMLEPTLTQDPDGDGVNTFDEVIRFHTNPNNPDTDGDLVKDKNDIAEYIFDVSAVGNYVYTPGMTPKTSDFDGDGKRKEVDADNDNDGSLDGCEDANLDGEFDGPPAETSNFFALGGQVCQPKFNIVNPLQNQAVNAGDPSNPDKVLIKINMTLPPATNPMPVFASSQFSATIGGKSAPVISGVLAGQTYWLLVQAPGQESQSFFDLKVDFDGGPTGHNDATDTELLSVYYVPRPRVETMVVFDRSGSMADANKINSAKNAARLYIDQWTENDRIGLVTFGDTATMDQALTTIGADGQVMDDTKELLDDAVANGQTAMGPGLLAAQNELAANADPAHTWSMMLLTDGQENVAPYWADAAVSGVIIPSQTIVNTVGVGVPLSPYFTTLQAIAGGTGGHFEALDDPSLLAAETVAAAEEVMPAEVNATTFATALSNQLADAYKYSAEAILGEQRLYAASGNVTLNPTNAQPVIVTHRFHVGDIPSLLVVGNFDRAGAGMIKVFDPTNTEVTLLPAVQHRFDATHDQYRIGDPTPGLWRVQLMLRPGQTTATEYALFASGDSPLTLNLVTGDPIYSPNVIAGTGVFLPVAAFLADGDSMITEDATVSLEVKLPSGQVSAVTMFDDGAHGDGAAGDGIWGATIALSQRGPYSLVGKATIASPGATYRYAKLSFNY